MTTGAQWGLTVQEVLCNLVQTPLVTFGPPSILFRMTDISREMLLLFLLSKLNKCLPLFGL